MKPMTMCLCSLLAAACGNPGGDGGNENELITTVTLTFSGVGGPDRVFEHNDLDGDGGDPPTTDAITLPAGMYTLTVTFENRLETPPEDITQEVLDEADDHQVFFTTNGGLSHAYADVDSRGLPIGLQNMITATSGGGDLTVTLRHMPPVNDQPVKDGTTAAGQVDATAVFAVTVQ